MKCDVLIVGAGPAGSMAAKTAAKRDVDVIVIERNKKIGYPVRCAEGINKFLFQDTGIKKDNSFIEQVILGTKVYFYDEVYELNSPQWQGYTIDRTIFDTHLAQLAEKAGAQIFTETKAVGMKREGKKLLVKVDTKMDLNTIEAKIIIGADGFECNVGRWAGIRKKWNHEDFCKCYELFVNCPNLSEPDRFHMAFAEEFPMGYAWIFPKKKKANIGVGVSYKASVKDAFSYFVNEYPGIKSLLGKYSILERRGGNIPMSGPKDIAETVADGVILAGDAAGMVDPITGEGISFSMISGISAGEASAHGIEKNEWNKKALSIYNTIWNNKKFLGEIPLLDEIMMLTNAKNLFYHVFTNKSISREARSSLISILDLEDEDQIAQSISNLKEKYKVI